MLIYILHAHQKEFKHNFSEQFSSIEKLESYLSNHPEVAKDEITMTELDPK